ncbi:hypothetical protein HYX15_03055 [Candidatus Woesearchaeota archaeon]|nr:hypothetical protein [Candidatus Woesearchaeota archaeon]
MNQDKFYRIAGIGTTLGVIATGLYASIFSFDENTQSVGQYLVNFGENLKLVPQNALFGYLLGGAGALFLDKLKKVNSKRNHVLEDRLDV